MLKASLRFSFPQLLLVAFVLIGALLGAAALRALFSLDTIMAQSRESTTQAIALSTAAQSLSERSLTMERAARQALVLGDRQLRQRFEEAAGHARDILRRLESNELPPEFSRQWLQQLSDVEALLDGSPETALDRERAVARAFRDKIAMQAAAQQRYASLRGLPAQSACGTITTLMMNAGLMADLPSLEGSGAQGVGLFRTELQFMMAQSFPKVDAQARHYSAVLDQAHDKPVTFRTLDIGADKVLIADSRVRNLSHPRYRRSAILPGRTTAEWLEILDRMDVPASPYNSLDTLIACIKDEISAAGGRALYSPCNVARSVAWPRPVRASEA